MTTLDRHIERSSLMEALAEIAGTPQEELERLREEYHAFAEHCEAHHGPKITQNSRPSARSGTLGYVEMGPYLCHGCNTRSAWALGMGWRCDNCDAEGTVILVRNRRAPTTGKANRKP